MANRYRYLFLPEALFLVENGTNIKAAFRNAYDTTVFIVALKTIHDNAENDTRHTEHMKTEESILILNEHIQTRDAERAELGPAE